MLFYIRRGQLLALLARHAVPAIYDNRLYVDADGLISYGPSNTADSRQIGIYAGKILNGLSARLRLWVARPTVIDGIRP